jgi:MFS family permease
MTTAAPAQFTAGPRTMSLPFIIGASSVGTLIEWYDFYIYGIVSAAITAHFFPAGNTFYATLAFWGVFWFGFILRPFGAIIFGHLGDMIGRKFTFMLTLGMMGAATFLVGCVPGYDSWGFGATVAILLLRAAQGLALGGEYGGAATYIAEHAPDGRRGFYTSWIQTTATMGIVLALLVVLILRQSMDPKEFSSWGWRIPFWLSAVLVLLSGYIRLKLAESPLYARLKDQGKASANPVKETYSTGRNWGLMAFALFGATAPEGVVWYTGQFYALVFLSGVLGAANYPTTYAIMMVALTIGSLGFIFFGWLSDRVGRRPIMTAGFALAVITYWPVFTALRAFKDTPAVLTLLVLYLVILVTMVYGPIAAFLVELFPARIRYSSMSMPYHIGNGWFGGGVPFIGTLITGATGIALGGLFYPMAVAAIGVIVSQAFLREPTHQIKIWDEVGGPPPLVPDQP